MYVHTYTYNKKNKRIFSQVKNSKGAGGMSQVVEHLPTTCESLSSNPSTIKKKIIIRIQRELHRNNYQGGFLISKKKKKKRKTKKKG
jgi:hypothetical protein